MKVCFTCALHQSRSLHGLRCSQILSFCVHIFLLCLTHSTSLPRDQHILLHYILGRASSIGGLHTSPFLPTASDFHQLGVFCLLCLFDMPLRCALSGQIQEYMSSPMGCVPKYLFILDTVSMKCLFILLVWKNSSQGYILTLTDNRNLSCSCEPQLQWITAQFSSKSLWIKHKNVFDLEQA